MDKKKTLVVIVVVVLLVLGLITFWFLRSRTTVNPIPSAPSFSPEEQSPSFPDGSESMPQVPQEGQVPTPGSETGSEGSGSLEQEFPAPVVE